MAKAQLPFDGLRLLARNFPDLEEGTTYGTPAIKLGKRMVACVPNHRSAEPGSLAFRTGFEERAALLADDPATFYVTEHYVNHPVVLVRAARLGQDQLGDLLKAARTFILKEAKPSRKTGKRTRP